MVIGAPGSGKSMLAQQISFPLARAGAVTIYLTGYSEPHDKLLAHARTLRFFDPTVIGGRLQFLSLADLLGEGAAASEQAIVDLARQQRAALVVLDGFRGMRRFLEDEQAVAHFLYMLGTKLALVGATTLVNVEGDLVESARYSELTVCDTIISLRRQTLDTRHRRVLDVVKHRGSMPLSGLYPFTLDQDGITVHPRFESLALASMAVDSDERADFGIPAIDTLVSGGLTRGTTTLVGGTPGIGKTLLGLHFVAAGARAQEPSLFLGFTEDAVQLRRKSRMFGLGLAEAESGGVVRLLTLPGYDLEADAVADQILLDLERRGTRRLVIDSVSELERGLAAPERRTDFLAALVAYLRGRDVTTYVTTDLTTIVGTQLQFADTPLSSLAENLLLVRYAEYGGQLHRLLSVLKMRFSNYDRSLYEYTITTGRGIELLGKPPAAYGLLTGQAQLLSTGAAGPTATLNQE
jgi:circadian clock protein KaiC